LSAESEGGEGDSSQSIHGIEIEKDVRVRLRDGVQIYVDIFRPDAEGEFPALVTWSAYGKEKQSLSYPPQVYESRFHDGNVEAADYEFLVPRGYALLIPDPRGVGQSDGEYICPYSVEEATDLYDVVEWAAEQPWCNGNVGLIGYSYFGMIQPICAALHPPHLKAIAPWAVPADWYRNCYNDGVLNTFYHRLFTDIKTSGKAVSVLKRTLPREELDRLVKAAKDDPDLKQYVAVYQILDYPDKNPVLFDVMLQPHDGPFYWERSPYRVYDRIKIPAYFGVTWGPPFNEHVRGAFKNYLGVDVPKKLIIMSTRSAEPRYLEPEEQVRWFDHWLKGVDNGIMDEPPIKIWVTQRGEYRYENEWPLARTKWAKFYLRTFGRLTTEPDRWSAPPDAFAHVPPNVTLTPHSLKYTTAPLPEDTEVTGPVALYLYAAIDQDDANWHAQISDVDATGKARLVTNGWLKASHRAIDKVRSRLPWLPEHLHTEDAVEPVVPCEINEYAMELIPCCNVFFRGHRIQLEISSNDPPEMSESGPHVCSSRVTLHKIYRDRERRSHLLLPIIPQI